jgi:hypothetical protein
MLIEAAIKRVNSLPDHWVRVEQIRSVSQGLELLIAVYKGRRGRRVEVLRIRCFGIREFHITDVDGGGLAIYPSTHPAVRQYVARQARIRWSGCDHDEAILGALCLAHREAVDDWIPIDRYINIRDISEKQFVYRGPAFLMRVYAKALRALGAQVQITLLRHKAETGRPKVLHFGSSAVVAARFVVQPEG